MNRVVTAVFDGHTLQFETPLELQPNARYQITIKPEPSEPAPNEEPFEDAWDVLDRLAGTIDGPPDWSLEHGHYIHGTPKRYGGNPE